MYAVRILVDGRIFVLELTTDKVWGSYKINGTPSYGCINRLELTSAEVIDLASDAKKFSTLIEQEEWFAENVH